MKNKIYSLLKFLIGWPLSIAAFFFIFKLISPQAETILSNSANINPALFTYGIISFVLFYFIRSYIWHRLITGLGHTIPFKNSCYMWAVSELKRYIPGNVWSFLGRTMLFAERGVSKKDIGKSLIIEAELFVLGSLVISLLSLPFIFPGFQLQFNTPSGFAITSIMVLAIAIFCLLRSKFEYRNPKSETNTKDKNIKKQNVLNRISNLIFPPYKPSENLLLVLLSSAALFFFGLGNYLVIGSYMPLHPQMVLELTGFFVLSFLVGYLSILTPAGFGVREGMMIFGLSKITTPAIAAFASVFSRIILILSELIFVALALLWHHSKKWKMAENWLSTHPHEMIVGIMATMYTIYISSASFLRYDNYYTGRFDLGNMAQTVWNTTQGRIFLFTNPNGTETVSRLAFHADFILAFLAPFYLLWDNPKMLLLLQVVVVAAGAYFVYLISNHILKNKNISLAFAFAYLINPALQRANLYDFHAVVLATTFLLATYYFYLKKNYGLFILMAVLAAFCKEQLWLIIALFGGLLIIRQKKYILGGAIALISVLMFYLLIWQAIPNAMGAQHFALSYYADFGDKPSDIIKAILFSPDKIYAIVTEHSRVEYLKQIFSPLGYLPLLAPIFLIFAGPDFTINLLSNNAQLHQIYYQYTASITPFLFIAGIWGVWVIMVIGNKVWKLKPYQHLNPSTIFSAILIFYIIASSLNAAYKFGPMPGSERPVLDMLIKPLEERAFVDQYLSNIPEEQIVAASNNLGSHLSHREHIYVTPLGVDKADIIVLLLSDPWSLKTDTELVKKLEMDPNYKLLAEYGRFYAFKKIK